MKHTYKVEGMHCTSCSKLIQSKVKKMYGVTECEVDYPTSQATIDYDPTVQSLEGINSNIDGMGYALRPLSSLTDKDSHQSIHMCCKVAGKKGWCC